MWNILSAFSIPVLRAVCCNLNLNFIFYNGSNYLLLSKCSVQNRDMEWSLILVYFTFFVYCFIIFFCNCGRWSLDKAELFDFLLYLFGISVQLYWENHCLCFSGRCLHNPVHTPILSLYWKTVNKKKWKFNDTRVCMFNEWLRILTQTTDFKIYFFKYQLPL